MQNFNRSDSGQGNEPMPGFGGGQRPWFGPRRFGIGYRPQTWQGYVLTLGLALLVFITAVFTRGPLLILAIVVGVVVHLIVIAAQRPRS